MWRRRARGRGNAARVGLASARLAARLGLALFFCAIGAQADSAAPSNKAMAMRSFDEVAKRGTALWLRAAVGVVVFKEDPISARELMVG